MKVLAADPINERAAKKLSEFTELKLAPDINPENLLKEIPNYDVLIVRSRTKVTKEVIDAGKNLKAIVRAGVGLDNIDVPYAEKKGIQVLNTPEAPTQAVAELTLCLILSLLRNIPKADASVKEEKWLKKELYGKELYEKTLGIIGFGRIGHRVAMLAKSFDVTILVYDPHVDEKYLKEVDAKKVELEELLKNSDIVTIHAPLTNETQGMIGENELNAIKDNAYLINTARGPIVDEEALYNALKSGKLAGVALDVYWEKTPFNSKIMEVKDKVVFTPHLGGSTEEAQARIGDLLVEKIKSLK